MCVKLDSDETDIHLQWTFPLDCCKNICLHPFAIFIWLQEFTLPHYRKLTTYYRISSIKLN